MNHFQLIAFFLYYFSVLIAGVKIYSYINKKDESFCNWSVYLGETYLLGAIFVIGELLILSLVGLYRAPFLWGCIGLNYLFLLEKNVRQNLCKLICNRGILNIPTIIFCALLGVFIFRNYFFLITGDSHSIYLFVQKLWLAKGTSLLGNEGHNFGIFTPHFNAVPYSLGLSLFGQETLFPQLINISWRVVVLLLVYGYTSYRFNGYYGLIASILVLFDEHFFYSGINVCVVLNGAVIALLFACIYNFWESRKKNCRFRLLLALIFLSQLMANKYQFAIVTFLVLIFGLGIQPDLFIKIKGILSSKRSAMIFLGAVLIASLWYLKNFLVTGCPTFPILADKFGVLNWTPEMAENFSKIFGGLSLNKFFKYLSYFYIWSGVLPLKLLALVMSGLPIIFVIAALRSRIEKESTAEISFWLGVSLLVLAGLCFVVFCDPRVYRYGIAVFSYTLVGSLVYILRNCVGLKKKFVLGAGSIIIFISIFAIGFMTKKNIPCAVASIKDNIGVLLNRTHMTDVIPKYYPLNAIAKEEIVKNNLKYSKSAWDIGRGGASPFSAFLLPERPQVGIWVTTLIQWESYEDEKLVIKDLNNAGVEWVMTGEGKKFEILTASDYAKRVIQIERYPETINFNYGFPDELSRIHW